MCNYVHFQAAFIGSVYWFESNVYLTALLPLLNGSDLSAKGAMHGPPAACISTSVVIFGVMIGLDRTWMPRWDTNVLGWSYGIVVVAGFFSTFSFIAIVVYTLARKYEIEAAKYRAVDKAAPNKSKAQLVPKV